MKKWKIPGIISLGVIAAVGIVVTLIMVSSPGEKQIFTPLEGLETGELVAISDKDRASETGFSIAPLDSLDTMEQTAAIVKKRFERIRAEKILLADKETLTALLAPVKDWRMENPQYHRGGYGEEETTHLAADFAGPDSMKIQVEIIDYGAAPSALQPLKMIFKMERDEETAARNGRVSNYSGILVFREYNRRSRQRQFSAVLKDRFLIKLTLRGKNTEDILQNFTRLLLAGNT